MSGQAARTSLLAASIVGVLGSTPTHAAVKAKAAAAVIPCAKSAPVGDADVTKVVVGRDKRGWQLDEHHRNGGLSITRCDANGRFARSQQFAPVHVASGGTVLALTDDARPWRTPDGGWGKLERSVVLAEGPVPTAVVGEIRGVAGRLQTVPRANRQFARSWGGLPKAKASDTHSGLTDACTRPNDYSTGAFWHRNPNESTEPERVGFQLVGSRGNAADLELAQVGTWAAEAINHIYTDCQRTVDAPIGYGHYWYPKFPRSVVWPPLEVQAPSAWIASAPTTTLDGVTTLRWGTISTICGSSIAASCTIRQIGRDGYLADADIFIQPDNSILPGYPERTWQWGGQHEGVEACRPAMAFCGDLPSALLNRILYGLGLNNVTTSSQTMYGVTTRYWEGRTLGKGDINGLTRVVY